MNSDEKDPNFALTIFIIILYIGMFALTSFTTTYLIGQNQELSKEIVNLRSALESSPEYLFDLNRSEGKAGSYYLSSQNIVLYTKSASPYLVGLNAHHEIGHYVWYEFLSENLKKEYTDIFNNSKDYISTYAETNVEEDFAETVSKSIVVSIDYSKIPENRRDFVKDYVEWYITT